MNRRDALAAGAICATAFVLLALVVALAPGAVDPLDITWNGIMVRGRLDVAIHISHVMNLIGGGWAAVLVVPIILSVITLLMRGWRTTIVVIAMMIASVTVVQVVKTLIARERPVDMLVSSDFGSFPSGHTANAATVAIVLCLLLPRAVGIAVGIAWTILMAASRTVLSVHWLTDTIGGALVGAGVALLVVAAFAPWTRPRRLKSAPTKE
ncbi:MAG: phosphatase PAP2 family protein [Microbacterium gubbeenense]